MRHTTVGRSQAVAKYQFRAPGTGTPEPRALERYQVTTLLRLVAAEINVVAAHIVPVSPVPAQVVIEFLAARLEYKLMCYVQTRM